MSTPNKPAVKTPVAPATLGKKATKTATPPVTAKAAPVVEKKVTPVTPPAPVKKEVVVTAKPPKAVKPAAVKPVIKAAVEPQPVKRSALELSLARVKKAAAAAVDADSTREPVVKTAPVKDTNTHLPEAMVRKAPPVVKKAVVTSGKASFSDLMEASKAAQSQAPAPLFDVTRHLKR